MKTYIDVSYTLKRSAAGSCKAKQLKLFDIRWCWILATWLLNSDRILLLPSGQKKQMILTLHSLENMWGKKTLPTYCNTRVKKKKNEPKQKVTWKYN